MILCDEKVHAGSGYINTKMLTVGPPGDFCIHQGTFTFSEVCEAFLLFVTIIPIRL